MPEKQKNSLKPNIEAAHVTSFDWYSASFKAVAVSAKRVEGDDISKRAQNVFPAIRRKDNQTPRP